MMPIELPVEQNQPIVEGPLSSLEGMRSDILKDVVETSFGGLADASSLELILGEALYSERIRMKRDRGNIFTRHRRLRDQVLWNNIQAGLLRPSALVDRKQLLEMILKHYAEEIGGHFDPRVYRFAVSAVPWGFNWLLNAASVGHFLPWKMKESLRSRIQILGEVSLLQRLAQKGTILLVPTHQSNIDSVLIGYVIYLMSLPPFAYGAGLNLFSNPVLNFFMSRLGAYTVDRQKTNQLYKEVLKNYSTRILQEGIHSIFFPGGGRSRSGAIETKLKLGLLGTGLSAQLGRLKEAKPNSSVYIVPMVMSYHFVLEAGSLIEDHLAEAGKHRFIITDDESWQFAKVFNFFWKFFSAGSGITVRIGRPLDVFGNFVDEDGYSIGPNGTTIDPRRWLTTGGQLTKEPQRDHEYTSELGERLVERFHRENTVLSSHLVAFAFFETLRKLYPDLDLYRFLRISLAQRSLPLENFLSEAEMHHQRFRVAEGRGELHLSEELKTSDTRGWVLNGIRNLGYLHDAAVLRVAEGAIWTEDMNLLYYYRNRLSGYGLSLLSKSGHWRPGQHDSKGFLA
jgi:glycerol-3-phosphate O-acyltransferase